MARRQSEEEPAGDLILPKAIEPGRRLGSQYIVGDRLGRGAMGVVHEAITTDGRTVAVKFLRAELAGDDKTVARFLQERHIFRRLDHPNVVRVLDLVAEGDDLAIVMEKVSGGDLKQRIADRSLSPVQAIEVASGIAAGIGAIHEASVVHRDLKPANILVTDELVPKISDFGISRLVSDAMTRTSVTIGTPLYMAPEAADQRGASAPSDVYALGIILFEMLIGRCPFLDGGTFAIIRAHAMDPPPRIGGVPEELADLVDAMLAKEPADRPTIDEVSHRLGLLQGSLDPAVALQPVIVDRAGSVEPASAQADGTAPVEPDVGAAIDPGATSVYPDATAKYPDATAVYPDATSVYPDAGAEGGGANPTRAVDMSTGPASPPSVSAPTPPVVPGPPAAAETSVPPPTAEEPSVLAEVAGPAATGWIGQPPTDSEPGTGGSTQSDRRRRGLVPIGAAVVALLALAGMGLLLVNQFGGGTENGGTTTTTETGPTQSTEPPVTTTSVQASTSTTEQTPPTPSTTSTTEASTTSTTEATTTSTSTTVPEAVPIEIVSGPTVNVLNPTSFQFNYFTNDVCGSGSFRVVKVDDNLNVGTFTGDNICFGPEHGGFPGLDGDPNFDKFLIQPGTEYRVIISVRGTEADGSRPAGAGTATTSFLITTPAG